MHTTAAPQNKTLSFLNIARLLLISTPIRTGTPWREHLSCPENG
jgi:hypothetical protein